MLLQYGVIEPLWAVEELRLSLHLDSDQDSRENIFNHRICRTCRVAQVFAPHDPV